MNENVEPQMVERDRKSLRMARFGGFAISTAFLDGPALSATPEGARTHTHTSPGAWCGRRADHRFLRS